MNYKKRGFKQLMNMLLTNKIKHLVIMQKDRLLRFGSEIIFNSRTQSSNFTYRTTLHGLGGKHDRTHQQDLWNEKQINQEGDYTSYKFSKCST